MASPSVAADPGYGDRVRASFAKQGIMALLGARLLRVEPGLVEIELPFRADLVQQDGYLHAGVVTTIADSAGGYAALSLQPIDVGVLTVEFKINFLAPAVGDRFVARGRVVQAGRTLSVCTIEADAIAAGASKRCLYGTQTIFHRRPDAARQQAASSRKR